VELVVPAGGVVTAALVDLVGDAPDQAGLGIKWDAREAVRREGAALANVARNMARRLGPWGLRAVVGQGCRSVIVAGAAALVLGGGGAAAFAATSPTPAPASSPAGVEASEPAGPDTDDVQVEVGDQSGPDTPGEDAAEPAETGTGKIALPPHGLEGRDRWPVRVPSSVADKALARRYASRSSTTGQHPAAIVGDDAAMLGAVCESSQVFGWDSASVTSSTAIGPPACLPGRYRCRGPVTVTPVP
jgi:hypothetical protein